MADKVDKLNIIVVGASGDLAKKKIFPALFALFCQGHLAADFHVFGFARSEFADDAFRKSIADYLNCRYEPDANSCAAKTEEFLSRCSYVAGQYDSPDSFLDLYQAMLKHGYDNKVPKLFYMAIPPFLFAPVAKAFGDAGLVNCDGEDWPRAVIEKPFGRDRESSDRLADEMGQVFTESQTYRIDHYLGKEIIQNLMVLRFANLVFEPLWNKECISKVEIDWRENIGVADRGGYFDGYGIVRDIIQNHLMQILALVAMERPKQNSAVHIRDEKVRVLSAISPIQLDHLRLGQYAASDKHRAYLEEKHVPEDSITPTCASVTLDIDNDRWRGVPFVLSAGKGLDARRTEVRITFRSIEQNIFCDGEGCLPGNELVIRIQPDEAIYLKIMNKKPGLGVDLAESELNLQYSTTFDTEIPEAYESLILDVIKGDKSLFIRADELAAAWDIFTPVLHEAEEKKIQPKLYRFGASGLDDE